MERDIEEIYKGPFMLAHPLLKSKSQQIGLFQPSCTDLAWCSRGNSYVQNSLIFRRLAQHMYECVMN